MNTILRKLTLSLFAVALAAAAAVVPPAIPAAHANGTVGVRDQDGNVLPCNCVCWVVKDKRYCLCVC